MRAVVIGAVGRSFCAGFDLKAAAAGARPDAAGLGRLLQLITTLPKPVVAAVDGAVRGGGMGIVAAADVALASARASFAFSEVRLGVTPSIISVVCSRRLAPWAFSRFALTAEVFPAEEALRAGLVSELAADTESLAARVEGLAAAFALAEPGALAATKDLVRSVGELEPAAAWGAVAGLAERAFTSAAAAEGIAAFLEKRPPSWVRPAADAPDVPGGTGRRG